SAVRPCPFSPAAFLLPRLHAVIAAHRRREDRKHGGGVNATGRPGPPRGGGPGPARRRAAAREAIGKTSPLSVNCRQIARICARAVLSTGANPKPAEAREPFGAGGAIS